MDAAYDDDIHVADRTIDRATPAAIAIALKRRASHLQGPPQPVGIPLFEG